MGILEDYKKKLEVISAIKDSQIKKPHHIVANLYPQGISTSRITPA